MKNKFSCVMANMPDGLREKYLPRANKLIPDELFVQEPIAKGFEYNPHVTVLYGFHFDEPTEYLITTLNKFPKFIINLEEISLFNADDYDVLKITAKSPELYILHNILKENTENTVTFEYSPHLTIGYVEKGSCDHLVGNKIFSDIDWEVKTVVFSNTENKETPIRIGTK